MAQFQRTSRRVDIPWARMDYPKLFEPEPIMLNGRPKGEPKYSVKICLNKTKHAKQIARIRAACDEIIAESWPHGTPVKFHHPLTPDGQEDFVINAYSAKDSPPSVGDSSDANIPLQDRTLIYSGAEARIEIGLYSYENTSADGGIGAGLNCVQPSGRRLPRMDGRKTAGQAFAEAPDIEAPDYDGIEDAPPPMDDETRASNGADTTVEDIPWWT